jgi:hypothetical protein
MGYPIKQAEEIEDGARVHSQQGISLESLVARDPQGQEAGEILEEIQQSVSSK